MFFFCIISPDTRMLDLQNMKLHKKSKCFSCNISRDTRKLLHQLLLNPRAVNPCSGCFQSVRKGFRSFSEIIVFIIITCIVIVRIIYLFNIIIIIFKRIGQPQFFADKAQRSWWQLKCERQAGDLDQTNCWQLFNRIVIIRWSSYQLYYGSLWWSQGNMSQKFKEGRIKAYQLIKLQSLRIHSEFINHLLWNMFNTIPWGKNL